MEEKEAEIEEGNEMIEKVARIEIVKIGKDGVVEAERGIGERIVAVIMIMTVIEIMDGIGNETETEAGTFTEKGRVNVLLMCLICPLWSGRWHLIETFELNWHL